jgi:RNA polymerase sigma-70 factor (ECF subfamily)
MTGDRMWARLAQAAGDGTPTREQDLDLVARVRARNADAVGQLLRTHNRTLFNTARAILLDDAQAEDAVEDAYLAAFRSLESFSGEASLSSWLARFAASEALARRGSSPAGTHRFADPGPHRHVERCIDRLPEPERIVFVMLRIARLPVEDVSYALDMRPAAVRRQYGRALARVRMHFAREELLPR